MAVYVQDFACDSCTGICQADSAVAALPLQSAGHVKQQLARQGCSTAIIASGWFCWRQFIASLRICPLRACVHCEHGKLFHALPHELGTSRWRLRAPVAVALLHAVLQVNCPHAELSA
jgi:hypothetical protein